MTLQVDLSKRSRQLESQLSLTTSHKSSIYMCPTNYEKTFIYINLIRKSDKVKNNTIGHNLSIISYETMIWPKFVKDNVCLSACWSSVNIFRDVFVNLPFVLFMIFEQSNLRRLFSLVVSNCLFPL